MRVRDKWLSSLQKTLMAMAAIWCMSSCEHKELCYDHHHGYTLNVAFDWRYAPNASPKSMFLYLFPRTDGIQMLRREFSGYAGGKTQVPVDMPFDAVFFNSDIKNTVFCGTSALGTFEATAKSCEQTSPSGISPSLPRATGAEGERMVFEADRIWSGQSDECIMHTLEEYECNDSYDVTFFPRQLFCTYSIRIANVKNIGNISPSMTATLSGMAGGRYVASRGKNGEAVTVSFPMDIDKVCTSIVGRMNNFGNIADRPNKLVLYTTLVDGSKWYYVYDVTDQIRNATDPYNVEIVLDTLPIPGKIQGDGGMNPSVGEWNRVDVDIKM